MQRAASAARAVVLVAGIALAGAASATAAELHSYPEPDYTSGIDRMATVDAIRFFAARVAAGRRDPSTLTRLARLHWTRYREIGDVSELDRAEALLREALDKHPEQAYALVILSSVRGARHQFDEALALAREAHALAPSVTTLSQIAGHLTAKGQYTQAQDIYGQAVARYGDEAALPGRSLMAELRGEPDEAVRLLERAAAASLAANQAGEAAAWYQNQLGGLLLELGRLDESERRFKAGRQLFAQSADALAGLGAVVAARGDLDAAIELTEQALSISGSPGLMIALGDFHVAAGRKERAEDYFARAVAELERMDPRAAGRELAMFYAEHDREPDKALRLARADFAERPDLHGHETLALALLQVGQLGEARALNDKALGFGIRDAALRYHAGLIALASGDKERARDELKTALAINPNWHVLHADLARAVLAKIASD